MWTLADCLESSCKSLVKIALIDPYFVENRVKRYLDCSSLPVTIPFVSTKTTLPKKNGAWETAE